MDTLDAIMALEGGEIDNMEDYAAALQVLIDSGIVWQLQGCYGRMASNAIAEGICHAAEK